MCAPGPYLTQGPSPVTDNTGDAALATRQALRSAAFSADSYPPPHPSATPLNWKINPIPAKVLADTGYCPFKRNLHFNRDSTKPRGINISDREISSTSS